MARRLTLTEREAMAWCARLPEYEPGFPVPFRVIWTRSRTWGNCPSVETLGETRLAYVKGCGFDKLSAALSQVLRFLPGLTPDGRQGIERANSAGLPAVAAACAAAGWELTQTYSGKNEDGFTIRRLPADRFTLPGECRQCICMGYQCPLCRDEQRAAWRAKGAPPLGAESLELGDEP